MKVTTPHYSPAFGTPKARIAEQITNAHEALDNLKDALMEIEFHRRDYTDRDWVEAVKEREEMHRALRMVEGYLYEHLMAALE